MIALSGFDELGESSGVFAPVELPAVDDNTADGGAVTTNPFGCAVDNDVSAVVDGPGEVAACSEGVVDLVVVLDV